MTTEAELQTWANQYKRKEYDMTTESQVLQLLQKIALDCEYKQRIKSWSLIPCGNNTYELHINHDWYACGTLAFIESKIREEYRPVLSKSTSREVAMRGYTNVWSGKAIEILSAIMPWTSFKDTEAIQLIDIGHGHVSLYVANEFIDWQYYRQTDEYIGCWGQTQVNSTRG